jgi:hypothetical protein
MTTKMIFYCWLQYKTLQNKNERISPPANEKRETEFFKILLSVIPYYEPFAVVPGRPAGRQGSVVGFGGCCTVEAWLSE